jgi:hypothetical protein
MQERKIASARFSSTSVTPTWARNVLSRSGFRPNKHTERPVLPCRGMHGARLAIFGHIDPLPMNRQPLPRKNRPR